MKIIGIIGGMSWESTIEYYKLINQEINKRCGNLNSAKLIIESYNFQEIQNLQHENNWEELANILSESAKKLEQYGADIIIIATNTMHKVADKVKNSINIPLFHITDATAKEIISKNYSKVALIGTKFTMNEDFYKNKLFSEYNIEVIIPNPKEQDIIHEIIYQELCKGIILDNSKNLINGIIHESKEQGAQAVILGCTELPNIIKESCLPIIDTTKIHCSGIVDEILN